MDKLITTDLVGAKKGKHPLTKESAGEGRKGFHWKTYIWKTYKFKRVCMLLHCYEREQTGGNEIPVARIGRPRRDLIC